MSLTRVLVLSNIQYKTVTCIYIYLYETRKLCSLLQRLYQLLPFLKHVIQSVIQFVYGILV